LETSTASELIEIDQNYHDRITLRKQIMVDHPETVLGANDAVQPAVNELYSWLMTTYLPTRFPRLFHLTSVPSTTISNKDKPGSCAATIDPATHLLNTANNDLYPLTPPSSTLFTLRILGGALEDDFLFLLPSPDGDGYTLQGFVTCFPSGFDTSRIFGLKLREIHAPVPGYAEKLETSMDRYFERLEVGRFVRRVNVCYLSPYLLVGVRLHGGEAASTWEKKERPREWSITTHNNLFTPAGNHLYEGEALPLPDKDVDIAN
ncbi:hypothetical protein MMC16_000228, partial [Acarospora aff. strigata]|nr:hypothetical protein [Acarospora aff. strigata]